MMTAAINSLYLSRLLLNPRSRQVMSEIAQPYEMHRTLMRAFPQATDDTQSKARDEFGVLFRAEVDDLPGATKVYIQSLKEPDWSFLDGLKDYLDADAEMPDVSCKDIMPAYQKLQNGQVLSFRLRANPTKRIAKDDDMMKGKRVELSREDEQIAWLIRKGLERERDVPGGFELLINEVKNVRNDVRRVPRINVCSEGKQQGRKRDSASGYTTTHLAVLFEGFLRVTDKTAFVETLIRGIGSGKAFGFGLLSIAPVPAEAK
ncbi:MAG: type I-E CRISPR-associated protein Cas6/Cse3/CasE [Acidobacteria bacterium]|nr:type I-E CRISPR-associated protein Cas6/Cse3/CasE [Acidobacteriota bacterium]